MKKLICMAGMLGLAACASKPNMMTDIDGMAYAPGKPLGLQRVIVSSVPVSTAIESKHGVRHLKFRTKGSDQIGILKLTVTPTPEELLEVPGGFDLRYLNAEAPEEVLVDVKVGRKVSLADTLEAEDGMAISIKAQLEIEASYINNKRETINADLCFDGVGMGDDFSVCRNGSAKTNRY